MYNYVNFLISLVVITFNQTKISLPLSRTTRTHVHTNPSSTSVISLSSHALLQKSMEIESCTHNNSPRPYVVLCHLRRIPPSQIPLNQIATPWEYVKSQDQPWSFLETWHLNSFLVLWKPNWPLIMICLNSSCVCAWVCGCVRIGERLGFNWVKV